MTNTKEIIDTHFKLNYNQYKKVCYNYCNGSVCHEELLHKCYEEFLKVKQETIIKLYDLNQLYNMGLRIIKFLFKKRFRVKKYNRGSTNDLFEFKGMDIENINENRLYKTSNDCYSEIDYLSLDKAINELLSNPNTSTSVTIFLQANETSINKLSNESGISRFYLTKEYNKAKEYLKTHIQNESRNNPSFSKAY